MDFTLSKQKQMAQKMYSAFAENRIKPLAKKVDAEDYFHKETGDSKYRACPLIRKMVRGGNLGCKTGKGFYVYNADRTKTPVDQL